MDTTPDLGVLAPESPWDYPTPLHTMIEASEGKRKAMQLAKKINAFPEIGAAYLASRPIEDQTCSICKNRYQHLPPLPADNAQYHTNNLAITDRSRIHNNNNNNLNLRLAYDPAICLPCGHILCKSCTKNWLSINPSCSTCRHPVPLPDIVFPKTAINRYMHTGNLLKLESTWGDLKVFILDSGLERCPRGGGGLDKGRSEVAKYEVDQWESSLIEQSDRDWLNKWNPT